MFNKKNWETLMESRLNIYKRIDQNDLEMVNNTIQSYIWKVSNCSLGELDLAEKRIILDWSVKCTFLHDITELYICLQYTNSYLYTQHWLFVMKSTCFYMKIVAMKQVKITTNMNCLQKCSKEFINKAVILQVNVLYIIVFIFF
jgi:hypothetical protein